MSKIVLPDAAQARSARAALKRDRLTASVANHLFSHGLLVPSEVAEATHSTRSTPATWPPALKLERLFLAKAPYTTGEPNPELVVTLPNNTNGPNIEAKSDYLNGLLSAQLQLGPPEDPQATTPTLPDSWLGGPLIESFVSLSQTIDLPDDERFTGWLLSSANFVWLPPSPEENSFDAIAAVGPGLGEGLYGFVGISAFLEITMRFVGNGAILSEHSNNREIASWAVENGGEPFREFAFAQNTSQIVSTAGPRPPGASQLIVEAGLQLFGIFGVRFDYLAGVLSFTFCAPAATQISYLPTLAPVEVKYIIVSRTNPPKPL